MGHTRKVLSLSEHDIKTLPPLIALDPLEPNRNRIASSLVQHAQFFHSLQPGETTLETFLTGLVESIQEQGGTIKPLAGQKLQAAAKALATSLTGWLMLDQVDCLQPADDVQAFFQALAQTLSQDQKVILNARALPHALWGPLAQAGLLSVVDARLQPTPRLTVEPQLEVYGFGRQVLMNGQAITHWDGPLVRDMFYYFLDHPAVTRDEIFQNFWSGMSIKDATNVFHVTKRKLTEIIGYELTMYRGRFYQHSETLPIHYDVAAFEQAIHQAREADPASAISLWTEAVRLYKGEFLPHVGMTWALKRRAELKLMYAEALVNLARAHEQHAPDLAIAFYLRAIREAPDREDLYRVAMQLHQRQGQTAAAKALYEKLAQVLERRWNIKPGKETRALYSQIGA